MYSAFRHAGSVLRKNRPIHLTFFVTRRCNSHCPFCFYLKKKARPEIDMEELDLAEISKVSGSIGSLLWLAFSGGEVYLRNDIAEIAGIFYRNNRPAIMLFPTNGLLPELICERTEEILRTCPKSVVAVKLSLDGVGPDHDGIRNTPGSFKKTMRTYSLLGRLLAEYPNFELGVNTVFCSQNQDSIDEIIDFVSTLGNVRTHTISLVRGDLSDGSFKAVDNGKYLRAIRRLEKDLKRGDSATYRFRGARIKAAQDVMQRRLIHQTLSEKKRLIPCFAGRLNLVLDETGDIYPCELLPRPFGNVRDYGYDIGRVLGSSRAGEILSFIRGGGCYCTHECYLMTNILFNPSLYPGLLREYLQVRS